MKTFDCPKCGASVTYDPNTAQGTARCSYCQSQLAVPDDFRGRAAFVIEQIEIAGPQVVSGAKTAAKVLFLIPISFVIVVLVVILAAFGVIGHMFKWITGQTEVPVATRGGPSGSRTGDPANSFATVAFKFGSEGIGPGMMTDARSISLDGKGNIYVGEYLGGRIQVFDSSGQFITQWMVDPKMPLRGLAADRKGTVYIAQHGNITKYEGDTGKSLGQISYSGGSGFDDVIVTPDGGLLCAWYSGGSDDIVRFNAEGKAVNTIKKAISTAADRSELNTRVAIDGLGNIYALGSFANGVFKFRPDGRFVNRIGSPGHQPGQISAAQAIAVDGKGRVFVSDIKGVQIFDSDGRYLAVFKAEGVAFGMVFNDKNELFIAGRKQVMKMVLNQ